MKFKNIWLFALIIFFSLSSCSDFVDGFEDDPNNSSDAPIEAILNGAFVGLIVGHEGEDARLACMWSRQFTGCDRQYSAFEVYNVNAENFEFDKYYLAIENAQIVIEKAALTNNLLASGIAKIIEAHSIGMVASLWGDVPYSEANKFPDIEDPVFDGQESIYAAVQNKLDDAISDLAGNPSNGAIEGIDFYFGGDAVAWTAVANTLKARFYMHTKQYSEALNAAKKGVASTGGDWLAPHATGAYNQDLNFYNSFGISDREGYMCAKDAILPTWLDPTNSAYRGNAKTDETARYNNIYIHNGEIYDLNYTGTLWGPTSPFPLVSAIENFLIIAETELNVNSDMGAALDALNEARAILAATYPEGKYEAYELADFEEAGIAGRAGESAMDALKHEIIEEKYASLVGQIEVYNDLRRTNNYLQIPATTGNAIPARFLVPQDEIDANVNAPSPIPDLFEPTAVNK